MTEYLIGDLHFFDPNIIAFTRLEFDSVDQMNRTMISNWNKAVTEEDKVFVLGDFFALNHCNEEQISDVLEVLNGQIVLIAGNHDRENLDLFRRTGLVEVIEYPILKDEFWILSHEPMYVSTFSPYANIFAHVHRNPMYTNVSCRSFCASAERIGYTPIKLEEVKRKVLDMCK